MSARFWLMALGVLGGISVVSPSLAQDDESGSDEPAEEQSGDDGGSDAESAEASDAKDAKEGGEATEAGADADASPVEEAGKTYHFVGARYRALIVPQFMIGLFAEGGTTVVAHSFGGEFAIRKDGFEYDFGLWYAAYSMDPTPFKSKSDPEDAWELVESNLKVLYLTADFLWSHAFSPEVALNYGVGAGFGFVFGSLYRTQAYRSGNRYLPCVAPGNPPVPSSSGPLYCGNDNDHYPGYEEPSWSGGGSKPILVPWLAAQTGLRYKPHRRFVGRLDAGFGLTGFFVGLGADYGL